ncbi:hypothetical protein DFH06DRAFT_1146151 [Mycena polygramma]|nr:hypothetical protein DFH06DRAFT_1146151 [Mycena polygramma]
MDSGCDDMPPLQVAFPCLVGGSRYEVDSFVTAPAEREKLRAMRDAEEVTLREQETRWAKQCAEYIYFKTTEAQVSLFLEEFGRQRDRRRRVGHMGGTGDCAATGCGGKAGRGGATNGVCLSEDVFEDNVSDLMETFTERPSASHGLCVGDLSSVMETFTESPSAFHRLCVDDLASVIGKVDRQVEVWAGNNRDRCVVERATHEVGGKEQGELTEPFQIGTSEGCRSKENSTLTLPIEKKIGAAQENLEWDGRF